MSQGILPYKYEEEKSARGMTSLAGLPIYLDLARLLDLGESISTHLHTKMQGWTDEQIVLSLLPEKAKTVRLRSDAAGYQHDLLKDFDKKEKHPRFGRIEFAIGCDVYGVGKELVDLGHCPTLDGPKVGAYSFVEHMSAMFISLCL
jgi:hypothetical protein